MLSLDCGKKAVDHFAKLPKLNMQIFVYIFIG